MKAVELRARLDRLRGTRMYTLSKDYGKLFDYLCAGNVSVGWVEMCWLCRIRQATAAH